MKLLGYGRKKDGRSKHPHFMRWYHIINRCINPKANNYHTYGGRGITVCDRWSKMGHQSFWNFVEDVERECGPQPTPKHQIDRIDNDKGYEPGNIRWATPKENINNTSVNRLITIDNETKTQQQWMEDERCKCGQCAFKHRIRKGANPKTSFYTPNKRCNSSDIDIEYIKNHYEHMTLQQLSLDVGCSVCTLIRIMDKYNWKRSKQSIYTNKTTTKTITCWGESKTIPEWVKDCRVNVCKQTIVSRLRNGWTIEKALTTPVKTINRKK